MGYDNMSLDGRVGFLEQGHKYQFVDNPKVKFSSVTGQLSQYKEKFDAITMSEREVLKKTSAFYGGTAQEVRDAWRAKANKASSEGTLLHAYGEDLLNGLDVEPPNLPKAKWVPDAIKDMFDMGYDLAKTELLVYSEQLALAGQSDIILKKKWGDDEDYSYAIYDWKFLGKDLQKKSFYNPRKGGYKKMIYPFTHLLDCNWIHYSIQLAMYQTMTGDPLKIREKVLVVVYNDRYEFIPCYPMRVFWDEEGQLHAVYEIFNGKIYDSRIDMLLDKWPDDIVGR